MSGEGDLQSGEQSNKGEEETVSECNTSETEPSVGSDVTAETIPETTPSDSSAERENTEDTSDKGSGDFNPPEPQDKKGVGSAKPQLTKIEVRLQPTGDAPIMKKRKWAVDPQKTIGQINKFVRGYIKLDEKENLFMYVNQAFAPSPDQTVQNLYECFGSDGNIVLHYSKNQAWG
jgi:ubiquitin-like protein ATG12